MPVTNLTTLLSPYDMPHTGRYCGERDKHYLHKMELQSSEKTDISRKKYRMGQK